MNVCGFGFGLALQKFWHMTDLLLCSLLKKEMGFIAQKERQLNVLRWIESGERMAVNQLKK